MSRQERLSQFRQFARKKRWLISLLAWLIAALFTLQVADAIRGQSLILRLDSSQEGTIQIFYSANESKTFTEEDSQSIPYISQDNQVLIAKYPRDYSRALRIVPFDDNGTIAISSIEINSLFSHVLLKPSNILQRISESQDIDQPVILKDRLIIRAKGKDPSFLLNLGMLSSFYDVIRFLFSWIAFSLLGFCLAGAPLKTELRRRLAVVIVPFVFSAILVYVFYPGYMNYDSLHALRAARNEVLESTYPPIVSYIWRSLDGIYPEVSFMFFGQVFLLLLSISVVAYFYTGSLMPYILFSVLIFLVPVLLGTISAIWKDVLMASFFMAAFACISLITAAKDRLTRLVLISASVLLLFLATASRHNAIVATVPFAFYLAWQIFPDRRFHPKVITRSLVAFGIIGALVTAKVHVDKYSLPSMKPIVGSDVLITIVRKMDIVGASICSNTNLFANEAPATSLNQLKAGYDPRHSNISDPMLNTIPQEVNVTSLWVDTMIHHPVCFWSNKFQLTTYMLGLNEGEQFLVAAPKVDPNEYGYYLPANPLREQLESNLISSSRLFFLRPWFIWLITLVLLSLSIRLAHPLKTGYLVLLISAAFYALGLFMFGNAADARLLFYSNISFLLVSILIGYEIYHNFRAPKGASRG